MIKEYAMFMYHNGIGNALEILLFVVIAMSSIATHWFYLFEVVHVQIKKMD